MKSLRHFATSPLRHFATSPLRHFATSPLRHASRLITLIGLALACAAANAALIINVEGVRGSGKTTWTLSGSGTATGSSRPTNTIRTGSGSNSFSFADTGQIDNRGKFLATNTTVGNNSLFAATGSAQITVGSQTRTITHVFLDPDQGLTGDDFGIRVNSLLRYASGANSSWTGRFTLDLDISNFNLGTYQSSQFNSFLFSQEGATLIFKETASVPKPPTTPEPTSIPELSSLALLGLALTGLGFSRKRKSAQPRA